MKRGLFITLDGGEGIGKSTQVNVLKERLPKLFPDERFYFTREPGGSPYAERIRKVILDELGRGADGRTMYGLFTGARADHVRYTILPALASGVHVISDRFVAATFAYQCVAMENPASDAEFLLHVQALRAQEAFPDLVILPDASVEVTQARVAMRRGEDENHFDRRGRDFHENLRTGYREFAQRYAEESCVLDAAGTPEQMASEIEGAIRALFKRSRD